MLTTFELATGARMLGLEWPIALADLDLPPVSLESNVAESCVASLAIRGFLGMSPEGHPEILPEFMAVVTGLADTEAFCTLVVGGDAPLAYGYVKSSTMTLLVQQVAPSILRITGLPNDIPLSSQLGAACRVLCQENSDAVLIVGASGSELALAVRPDNEGSWVVSSDGGPDEMLPTAEAVHAHLESVFSEIGV